MDLSLSNISSRSTSFMSHSGCGIKELINASYNAFAEAAEFAPLLDILDGCGELDKGGVGVLLLEEEGDVD